MSLSKSTFQQNSLMQLHKLFRYQNSRREINRTSILFSVVLFYPYHVNMGTERIARVQQELSRREEDMNTLCDN